MAETGHKTPPKAFISYSWDDAAHRDWVRQLAIRLDGDGVQIMLDQRDVKLGDSLPAFMEGAVSGNDVVMAICTPNYRTKANNRRGGVGYETDLLTGLVMANQGPTVIPVLRHGKWEDSLPKWLAGKLGINLSDGQDFESNYDKLRQTLLGTMKEQGPIPPTPQAPAAAEPPRQPKPKKQTPPKPLRANGSQYVPRPGLEKQVLDQFRRSGKLRADGNRIVTLLGEGGMGKTRLARRCGEKLGGLFPDGVHFVSLTNTFPTAEAVAEAIGGKLGLDASICQPATVLEHLKGRTTLLVLDNYESVADADRKVARYLDRLIAEADGLCLLVTGRTGVDIVSLERVIDLNVGMTPAEARDLFLARARLRWGEGRDPTAAEEPHCVRILEGTANIPLAIELATAWIGRRSLKEIVDDLAEPLGKVNALPTGVILAGGEDRHESLTRSLDWSYKLLGQFYGQSAQALFAACGLFADSFDEPTLAAVAGLSNIQDDLFHLADVSLIRRHEANGSTRYRLHRFTREYANQRLDADAPFAESTRRRFIAHYAKLVNENALNPNNIVRYAVLDQERPNVLAAFQVARSLQDSPSLYSMFRLGDFLQFRGLWAETEFLYQQVLTIAQSAGDKAVEGVILNNMGVVYKTQGRYAEALEAYAGALDIQREFADRVGEGRTLGNMGLVYRAQGRYVEALEAYAGALDIQREFADRVSEGKTLGNMGVVYQNQGRYAEALDAYSRTLAINREFADRISEGLTLGNMGLVYQVQSRYAEALDAYAQALAINREFADHVGEGLTLGNMGNLHRTQGRYAEALDAYAQALAIKREFADRVGEGQTLGNMGNLHQIQGRYAEALDAYGRTLDICREFADRVGEGQTLNNMGNLYLVQDRYAEALEVYSRSLDICREFADRVGEGKTLANMGNLYQVQDRYAEALEVYSRSLDICREFADRVGEGVILGNMGNLHQTQGRYAEALDAYAHALAINREFADRVGEGWTLGNLALLAEARGDLPEAIRRAQEAVATLATTEATMVLKRARETLKRLEDLASGQDAGPPGGDGD